MEAPLNFILIEFILVIPLLDGTASNTTLVLQTIMSSYSLRGISFGFRRGTHMHPPFDFLKEVSYPFKPDGGQV
jgi:hypothetical protein